MLIVGSIGQKVRIVKILNKNAKGRFKSSYKLVSTPIKKFLIHQNTNKTFKESKKKKKRNEHFPKARLPDQIWHLFRYLRKQNGMKVRALYCQAGKSKESSIYDVNLTFMCVIKGFQAHSDVYFPHL